MIILTVSVRFSIDHGYVDYISRYIPFTMAGFSLYFPFKSIHFNPSLHNFHFDNFYVVYVARIWQGLCHWHPQILLKFCIYFKCHESNRFLCLHCNIFFVSGQNNLQLFLLLLLVPVYTRNIFLSVLDTGDFPEKNNLLNCSVLHKNKDFRFQEFQIIS